MNVWRGVIHAPSQRIPDIAHGLDLEFVDVELAGHRPVCLFIENLLLGHVAEPLRLPLGRTQRLAAKPVILRPAAPQPDQCICRAHTSLAVRNHHNHGQGQGHQRRRLCAVHRPGLYENKTVTVFFRLTSRASGVELWVERKVWVLGEKHGGQRALQHTMLAVRSDCG